MEQIPKDEHYKQLSTTQFTHLLAEFNPKGCRQSAQTLAVEQTAQLTTLQVIQF